MKKSRPDKPKNTTLKCEALEPRILLSGGTEALLVGDSLLQDDAAKENSTEVVSMLKKNVTISGESNENFDKNPGQYENNTQRLELVIIDSNTPNYQSLLDDLQNNASESIHFEVLLLDADKDGIQQIDETLKQYNNIDALHIISHGSDANVQLGNSQLNFSTLSDYSDELQSWQDYLTAEADILIYGCDVADTEEGQDFIDTISILTGADVAASDDLTGHESKGGDWELEYQAGNIETSVATSAQLQTQWNSVLLTPTTPTLTGMFDHELTNTTTPSLQFSATVTGGTEVLQYEVQWDTIAGFATPESRTSLDDAALFINLDDGADVGAFKSGNNIEFTFAAAELTDGATYWWRVQASDSITGDLGAWSEIRSFTVDTTQTDESQWYQTTSQQFNDATLQDAVTSNDEFTRHLIADDTNTDGAGDIQAVDFDGDGDIDIVTAAYNADEFAWYENVNGDGSSFTRHVIQSGITYADGARSIEAVDFDGDGDMDAVTVAYSNDEFAWYENDGANDGDDTTFTRHLIAKDANTDGAYEISSVDFDG